MNFPFPFHDLFLLNDQYNYFIDSSSCLNPKVYDVHYLQFHFLVFNHLSSMNYQMNLSFKFKNHYLNYSHDLNLSDLRVRL